MNLKTTVMLLLVLSSCSVALAITAFGGITAIPPSPTFADTVTIRLANSFGAEANPGSASINRAGNAFAIEQNVNIACRLPSSPTVASEFMVGALAPGTYTVTANITFTGVPPDPCSPLPITQTATFTVRSAAEIPTLELRGLLLLGAALAVSAVVALRARG